MPKRDSSGRQVYLAGRFSGEGRKNWPFLFDTEHKPKQSYWDMLNTVRA